MKPSRYLLTMIAAAGMSIGASAMAQDEEVSVEDGKQGHCNITTSVDPVFYQLLKDRGELPEDTLGGDAFCHGLQNHDADGGQINFIGPFAAYTGSPTMTIMSRNDYYYWAGWYGKNRCKIGNARYECNTLNYQAYQLNTTPHPDYTATAFDGGLTPAHFEHVTIGPGEHPGIQTPANNVKVTFVRDPNNPNESTYYVKSLKTGDFNYFYMPPGDYFVEDIQFGNNTHVVVQGEGTVRLFLKNTPTWGTFTKMNWGEDPSKFVFVADESVTMDSNAGFSGYFYSKKGWTMEGYSKLIGALNAENIWLDDNGLVTEDITTKGNVNFGEHITASPSILQGGTPPIQQDPNRHSGTYELDYSHGKDSELFDTETYIGHRIFGELEDYLETDYMGIASVYGLVTISAGVGITAAMGFYVPIPVAHLNNEEIAYFNQDGSFTDHMEDEFWNKVQPPGNLDQWNFDPIIDGVQKYSHLFLPGNYSDTPEGRHAELGILAENVRDKADEFAERIQGEWNNMAGILPTHLTYNTGYLADDLENVGFAHVTSNKPGGWGAVMDNNNRLTLPIAWPVTGFMLPGWTTYGPVGLACGAWLAAFEVGCFEKDPNECEDPSNCPNDCTHHPEMYPTPIPVKAAFHMGAGANLTCAALVPNLLVTATLGFGMEVAPITPLAP